MSQIEGLTHGLGSGERLDSELLRTFLAIADSGSFSGGAERILRSQSATSLQIKRLERFIGAEVFHRHARGVTLTPTGERLRPVAQQVVDLLDVTIGDLRTAALEGPVRIGIPSDFGGTVLPDAISRFSRDHPGVELEVRCGFSAVFPRALADGALDLAVYPEEDDTGGGHLLLRERTLWACARHLRVQERDPLPVALFDRPCWWRDRALEALEAAGRRFRVVYSSESNVGVMAAIESGIAVGVLGAYSITGRMRTLSPEDGLPDLPDSRLVLQVNRRGTSPAVEAMAGMLAEAFVRIQDSGTVSRT